MSPTTPNFVHDLVEMAKAVEQLPIVQESLGIAERTNSELLDRILRLESKLMERANEVEALHNVVRKTEEERDEATRAFLEADDRTDKALAFVRSVMGSANALIEAVEPPKPQPEPQPVQEPTPVQPEGQSEIPLPQSNISSSPEGSMPEHGGSGITTGGNSVPSWADPGPAIASHPFEPQPQAAEEPAHVDPTVSAASNETGPDAPTLGATTTESVSPPTITEPSSISSDASVDDVGYHNEPKAGDGHGWAEWDAWCNRMNARYGQGQWPARPLTKTA